MQIDSFADIHALYKALCFLKFRCQDEESYQYAYSSSIARILDELSLEVEKRAMTKVRIEVSEEKHPEIFDAILTRINAIEGWETKDINLKRQVLENILSPFHLSEEAVQQLVSAKS